MRRIISGVLLSLAAIGCGDNDEGHTAEQCDDLQMQIVTALTANVANGVLVGTAIACGEDGVANRRDSFDSRASQEMVDSLQRDFAAACDEYESNC